MARASADSILGNLGAPPADEPATQPASKAATRPATKAPTKRAAPVKREPRKAQPAPQTPSPGERTPVATGPVLQGAASLEQLKRRRVELRQQLGVRVKPEIADRLRRFSVLIEVAQQDIVEAALTAFMDAHLGPEETGEEQ